MYSVIPKDQVSDFESFISKIPLSKVRSDIERLWDKVTSSGYRIKYEDLDKLKDFSIHLPANLQTFPASFEHFIKNGDDVEQREKDEKIPSKAQANLADNVTNAIEGVKVQNKDTTDTSVAPTEDRGNRSSIEPHPEAEDGTSIAEQDMEEKKSGVIRLKTSDKSIKVFQKSDKKLSENDKDLEKRDKEAKAGDLVRPVSALKADVPNKGKSDEKAMTKSAKKGK